MGLFRSVLLVGAGAAVGYFASKRASASPEKKTGALVQYQQGTLALNPESQVGKFFDSPVGKPLQPYALKAVEFAARVREGMQEKEAELHAKVERQKQDIRPGSIDTWDRQMSEQEIASTNRLLPSGNCSTWNRGLPLQRRNFAPPASNVTESWVKISLTSRYCNVAVMTA